MPEPPVFTCQECGAPFMLPEAVRAKYPGWKPRACMPCRDRQLGGQGSAARAPSRAPVRPVPAPVQPLTVPPSGPLAGLTAAQAAHLAAVAAAYSAGPQTGIFTDGACQPNPGPGGWGAVRVRDGEILAIAFGHEPQTTNNRMELLGMIAGLEMAAPAEAVEVYSDSQLVVNTLTQWARGWEARGWKRKEGAVKNLDLVQRAWALVRERPNVTIRWIRAHDGSRWNEYADALSTLYLLDAPAPR